MHSCGTKAAEACAEARMHNRVQDFEYFLAASAAKKCDKKAVIKSAASAASAKGGCASSQLDDGLKFYVNQGGCASSRLIHEFLDSALSKRSLANPTLLAVFPRLLLGWILQKSLILRCA